MQGGRGEARLVRKNRIKTEKSENEIEDFASTIEERCEESGFFQRAYGIL